MKLLTMKLINYRRFVGENIINFSSDDEKNITIIRAENGAGKTGILIALLFGLFGELNYDQFQISNDNEILVSKQLLNNEKSASATVEIEFLSDSSKYKIIREVSASNLNGSIVQHNNDIKVTLIKDGLVQDMTIEKINKFMDNLIGKNIRGFLFFDGVRYMDLFKRRDSESRKEIKQIIEKMLNITDLDYTIEALGHLEKSVVDTSSDKRLTNKIAELENTKILLKNNKRTLEIDMYELEKNNSELVDFISQQEILIKQNEQYNDAVKELDTFKIQLANSETKTNDLLNILKTHSKNNFINNIYSKYGMKAIGDYSIFGESKSEMISVINNILLNNKCICCDDVLTDDKRENLNSLIAGIESNDKYSTNLINVSRSILDLIQNSNKRNNFFIEKLIILNNAITEKEYYNNNILKIQNSIPIEYSSEALGEHYQTLGSLNQRYNKNEQDIKKIKESIEVIERDIEVVEEDLDTHNKRAAANNQEKEKFELYNNTKKQLINLKVNYLSEAQKNISVKANEYFMELLSEDDKAAINKLKINKEYEIEAYDYQNRPIFIDLSAGQKLLASMAFTMGMTAIASEAKPMTNFPLVMDTPFSNLDSENRKRLIKLMPKIVIQWILTPMDTELRNSEIEAFKSTNKLGNVYSLIKENENSKINEINDIDVFKEEL